MAILILIYSLYMHEKMLSCTSCNLHDKEKNTSVFQNYSFSLMKKSKIEMATFHMSVISKCLLQGDVRILQRARTIPFWELSLAVFFFFMKSFTVSHSKTDRFPFKYFLREPYHKIRKNYRLPLLEKRDMYHFK